MTYADGIETYVTLGDVIMPFGYHLCPHSFQRQLYDNYAKVFPFPRSPFVVYEDEDLDAGAIRKFTNISPQSDDAEKTLILYFHAGGFFYGWSQKSS